MDSIKDFSKDIRVFRNMVERSISPKLYLLDKELNRLRALPQKCEERFLIKLYGKRHYKNPGFWGNLKAHGWDIFEKLDDFFKLIQGENLPYDWYEKKSHFEQRIEEARKCEEELNRITKDVTEFSERVRSEFVLDATINYAKRKKHCVALDEETYGSNENVIPSRDEMHSFLLSISQMDSALKETILDSLSECAGFSIREAIIANDTNAVSSYLTELDDKYYPFAFEVSALKYGLQETQGVFQTIDQCLKACGKIDEKYYAGWYSAVHDLPKNLSTLCPKTADGDLSSRLAKTGYLYSQDEIDAIIGQTTLPQPISSTIKKESYVDPGLQDPTAYFLGLKDNLKDLTKLIKIAKITADAGYIKQTDIPLFVFRLSGNCRPEKLGTIKWMPVISMANRHKSSPQTQRHPYELYYLLHFMFEKTAGLEGKVSSFFSFEPKTWEKVRPILQGEKKAGVHQMAKMAKKEFQQQLHDKVDAATFPILK